jgi:enolase
LPKQVALGLDLAASEFFDPATARYAFGETSGGLASVGMIGTLLEWLKAYPLISIEDPLAEDDWSAWTDLTAAVPKSTMVVGDDLFVTNASRLNRGIEAKAGNAILIKLNQIGTVSETADTILRAQEAGYTVVISHRSGETSDAFIVDLAVASSAPFLKAGAPARGERVAKYNRLLEIEEELAS